MSDLNSPKLELNGSYLSVTKKQKPLNSGLISIAKEIMNLNFVSSLPNDIVFTIKKQPIRPRLSFVEFNRILKL